MFIRGNRAGGHEHLQIVESHWEDGRTRTMGHPTLGRLDRLHAKGQMDSCCVHWAGSLTTCRFRRHTQTVS